MPAYFTSATGTTTNMLTCKKLTTKIERSSLSRAGVNTALAQWPCTSSECVVMGALGTTQMTTAMATSARMPVRSNMPGTEMA